MLDHSPSHRLAVGACVLLLHGALLWAFLHDIRPVLATPKVTIVHVALLPAPPIQPKLELLPLPQFLRQAEIVALPPAFTIAQPRLSILRAAAPIHEPVSHDTTATAKPASNPPMDYLRRLVAHLNAYKSYPDDARILRQQGTVRLRFTLDRQGHVLSYRVVGSSGFASLDEEAKDMIQHASPFPAIPRNVQGQSLDLIVPLVFSLR